MHKKSDASNKTQGRLLLQSCNAEFRYDSMRERDCQVEKKGKNSNNTSKIIPVLGEQCKYLWC